MSSCRIQLGNRESLEQVASEFEVFSDQVTCEKTDSSQKPKTKIKLKIRKCLLEVSVEEMYSRRIAEMSST